MKQVLSKQQVNDNLNKVKQNVAVCYSISYNYWDNKPTFYIWFRAQGIVVVTGKKVYYHSFITNSLRGDEVLLMNFKGQIYTEFKDKITIEKLLVACGLKAEKKINPITPEQRLRQLECRSMADIYKMMQGLTSVHGELEYKTPYNFNRSYLALVVYHDKGSFSFPIENITGNADHDDEIQNIFFTALDMKLTNQIAV